METPETEFGRLPRRRLSTITEVNVEDNNNEANNRNRNRNNNHINGVNPTRNFGRLFHEALYGNNNNNLNSTELRVRHAEEIKPYMSANLSNPEMALQYKFLRRIHAAQKAELNAKKAREANGAHVSTNAKKYGTRRNEAWGEKAGAVNIRAAGAAGKRRRKTRRTHKTRRN